MIIKDNGLNIQRRQTVAEIRNTKKTLGRLKKGYSLTTDTNLEQTEQLSIP